MMGECAVYISVLVTVIIITCVIDTTSLVFRITNVVITVC